MENLALEQRHELVKEILRHLDQPYTYKFMELIDFYDKELKEDPEWKQELTFMREYIRMMGYKL